jgi:methylenetetrahydrofolate--tRNA-(uracil-5-)-methyltransferase
MTPLRPEVTVIGGGLAGCEAAWQLAERGVRVRLIDQKPVALSPAHQTPLLCELVCSNSLRSDDPESPAGLLKEELRRVGSLVLAAADRHRVPAGAALALERFGFARDVTLRLALHPNVTLERRALDALPDGPTIVATGPLTGTGLAAALSRRVGDERLYFYDAIAPIVAAESIDRAHAFRASRWGKDAGPAGDAEAGGDGDVGVGDYLNCPLDRDAYEAFVGAVAAARKVVPHAFEEPRYFESCMPIEVMVERGPDTLRFGPMRPVGLVDPRTGRRPWAVVQLRPENAYQTTYNLVGFQTRMAYPEQQRVFAMIPALREAEFLRFGSVHRNTYLDAPRLLGSELELRGDPDVRVAGLLTGVEGYIESCAMGLMVALFLAARLEGRACPPPPETTALGALYHHATRPRGPGQPYAPTNINFGLLPPLEGRVKKVDRRGRMAARARHDLGPWLARVGAPAPAPDAGASISIAAR